MNNSKIDTIEIQSKVLGKAMAMMVYVPADFTEGLPTLYFMHGRSGDESIFELFILKYLKIFIANDELLDFWHNGGVVLASDMSLEGIIIKPSLAKQQACWSTTLEKVVREVALF